MTSVADRLEVDGRGAAVAVVDRHGELVAFLRTDPCPFPSIKIEIQKAFTAAWMPHCLLLVNRHGDDDQT